MNEVAGFLGMDPGAGTPLFAPDSPSAGHWVGAPCVHVHEGRTYLAVRVRDPRRRGHALVVYERAGSAYDPVAELRASEFDAASVERAALATDPISGKLKCYVPVDRGTGDWRIAKLADVEHPSAFDASTAVDVLGPGPDGSDCAGVKDPHVMVDDGRFFMYYAGFDGDREQAHLAESDDGENWRRSDENPVLESTGWHDHHTRVSCVLDRPDGPGWLLFYDGSGRDDYGRTWNLRTGTALATVPADVTDCTPDGPAFAAPTTEEATDLDCFATCRYLDVLAVEDRWEVFAEVARDDEAFELRHTSIETNGQR